MFESFTKGITEVIDGVKVDITDLVHQVLREGIWADEVAAIRRQRRMAKLGVMDARPNRKLGTTVTRLDPVIYKHWEHVAGEGCWSDPAEMRSILKFAPELRCRQEKPMDRVGFGKQFATGYDRMAVEGRPVSREERLLV